MTARWAISTRGRLAPRSLASIQIRPAEVVGAGRNRKPHLAAVRHQNERSSSVVSRAVSCLGGAV